MDQVTLNTSETDNSELILNDSEALTQPDKPDTNSEPAKTCEKEIKSHIAPDNESHSKIQIGNIPSIAVVKNDVGTDIKTIFKEKDNSERILTKNPCEIIDESQSNAQVNNQDSQNKSTQDEDRESTTISVTPTLGVMPPIPDNKNNVSVNLNQSDQVSVDIQVEEMKKHDPSKNISEKIVETKPGTVGKRAETSFETNSEKINETQSYAQVKNQDSQNMSTEDRSRESTTISVTPTLGVMPPNPDNCDNKNKDSVNLNQSNEGNVDTQVEEVQKEVQSKTISGKIDDVKLELTNTPEKPNELNFNSPFVKIINHSESDNQQEYPAKMVGNLGSHNITNDNSNPCSFENVVETQEIVHKPSESNDIYLQFKSQIEALGCFKHISSNTADTSQSIGFGAQKGPEKQSLRNISSCKPRELMKPPVQYKWESYNRRDKFMIAYVFKLLGFQAKLKFDTAKEILKKKAKLAHLPPLTFSPDEKKKVAECRAIFTSNWPTWITPQCIKHVLALLTDIDIFETRLCIETLTYKDKKEMGAALISFTNAEVCSRIFNQLRNICLCNKDVKVEFDLDNKIRQTFIGVFIHARRDGSSFTITEDKWLTRPEENSIFGERLLRRVTVTSKESPLDYRPDTKPSYGKPRLDPSDDQQRAELHVIHRLLGLPLASFHETKQAILAEVADKLSMLPKPPFPKNCTSIFISNVPTWFEYIHFLYLLEVGTTLNWQTLHHYIEILQYSNGVNRGAALLRLRNRESCLSVFQELRGLCYLNKNKHENIVVKMDLNSRYENEIVDSPPNNWRETTAPVFRSRYVRTNVELPPAHRWDVRPLVSNKYSDQLEIPQSDSTENSSSDIESQSHVDINTEIPEDINLKQIINENLMDVDFKAIEEDNAPNTDDNSQSGDTLSTQHNTECEGNMPQAIAGTSSWSKEPAKNCSTLVHLKISPPGYKSSIFYQILKDHVKLDISRKNYAIRFLRDDEDKRILNECLLKFDSPDDACMVTQRLDGLTVKTCHIEAKLLQDSSEPSWENDNFGCSNPLKRKLGCGDDNLHESSISKKAKFDEEWEIGYYERSSMLATEVTEDKFGVNPLFLKKMNVKKFVSPNIVVSNLHKDVTENKLREIFSLAGRVTFIRKFVKPSYRARIEYEHPLEALQAISMFRGQILYGNVMNVAICTDPIAKFLPVGLQGIGKGFGPNGLPLKCVHSHWEARKIYDILHRTGQVQQNMSNEHPFLGEYTPSVTYPKFSNMNNPFNFSTAKPNVETAIEAFGTVLIALDIIPSEIDTKDLGSIVNALKKHPKLTQANKQHNIQQQQTSNQDPNNQVEALYQAFTGFMQHMGDSFPQLPGWSGDSQAAATNTGQNIFGPNFNNTGPSNVQQPTFPTKSHIRPDQSNDLKNNPNIPSSLHNMPILSKPTKQFVPPGFWNINTNAQSEHAGMPNMQNDPVITPNVYPNMQSFPAANPNINPNMQNFPAGTSNTSPNMQSAPDGTNNMMANTHNIFASISKMYPNMQRTPGSMPNISTNEQYHSKTGVDISVKYVPGPDNTKMKHAHPDKNQDALEALLPAPPRWGDPRFQEILEGNNMTQLHPPESRNTTQSSNTSPANEQRHNAKHTQDFRTHPSRPHYNPRSDSKVDTREDGMSSSDDFESDLLQFKNLPSSVTAKALARKMKEVGEIIFAELTDKGKALVRFKRVQDAERCIRLFHNSKVDGHVIDVTPV